MKLKFGSYLLVFLLIVPALYSQSSKQNQHNDSISTLKLDKKIQSWGRLGGIAVDRLGFIYMPNFGERVYPSNWCYTNTEPLKYHSVLT